jgi:hypothetical protein
MPLLALLAALSFVGMLAMLWASGGILVPDCLDDCIHESNPDLAELGFDGGVPEATGRPSYHPSALLKLYIYGYLNRI